MADHSEYGTEAERPADAPRDYPALLDSLVADALELALRIRRRRDGDDRRLRDILMSLVELGELARTALAHWPSLLAEDITPEE